MIILPVGTANIEIEKIREGKASLKLLRSKPNSLQSLIHFAVRQALRASLVIKKILVNSSYFEKLSSAYFVCFDYFSLD